MGLKSWAAAERCSTLEDSTVHCVVDITAVITSVSDFIKYILKAIDNCNPLKESNGHGQWPWPLEVATSHVIWP